MNLKKTIDIIRESRHSYVKIAVADIDGVLRGKIIHKDKCIEGLRNSLGFCDVIFGWDIEDHLYDKKSVTGWETGFPDAQFTLDHRTLRSIPYQDGMLLLLGDFSAISHPICPRTLLKTVTGKAREMGYETLMAQEFEWFLIDAESKNSISSGMYGYSPLRLSQNHAFVADLLNSCSQLNIPIEGLHTETGPGVYEACLQPTEALEAADRAILFKNTVKEIAAKHGFMATFMAKWIADLPGCGGHIHQSLWKNRSNVFFDPKAEHHMSEVFKNYIAGLLHFLPHILPMYAPVINSYKRLKMNTWAPTTVSWGIENRTTAVRVINTREKLTRAEMRVPGADMNPYLAFAASLASGLAGVERKLELKEKATTGNAYADPSLPLLSKNLLDSTHQMKNSTEAIQLLGESFVKHFAMTRQWECDQHEPNDENWEINRYMEII